MHEKMVTMQPTVKTPLSDADLTVDIDAFFAAIRSIAASNGNKVEITMRAKLVLSLLEALAD